MTPSPRWSDLFLEHKLVKSKTEARSLMKQAGLKVEKQVIVQGGVLPLKLGRMIEQDEAVPAQLTPPYILLRGKKKRVLVEA